VGIENSTAAQIDFTDRARERLAARENAGDLAGVVATRRRWSRWGRAV
jgi:hypothetical protein